MYLTQALYRAVQRAPDAPATRFGERMRTWRQHADRVARLAGALRGLGVRDGERVGILALNSDRYAELLLAVPWAGGVFTPVNIRWSPAEITYALRDSGITILCVDDASAGRVPGLVEGHPDLKSLIYLGDGPPPEGMHGYAALVDGARPVEDARRGGGELIVDGQDHELPRGAVGEVVCRGGHVMSGYWNRPQETAEALRGGWLHTGDAGYMDDNGYVYLVDRVKDMIVSGGENVYSAEVENAIASHPAVASCAVIAVPDRAWGERVHAVVVLRAGRTASTEEIREHCKP